MNTNKVWQLAMWLLNVYPFTYLRIMTFWTQMKKECSQFHFFVSLPLSATVQVRDKRPTHTQNARTIFAQTRVKKRVPKYAFAYLLLLFTLITVLCVAFFCTTKETRKNPTNAANRIFTPIKKQPISLFFAVFFDRALQSNTDRMINKLELSYIWFYKS